MSTDYELSTSWESSVINSASARIYLHLESVSPYLSRSVNFLDGRDTLSDFVKKHIISEIESFPTDYAGLVISTWSDLIPSYYYPATHFIEAGHILDSDCMPFLSVPLNFKSDIPGHYADVPKIFNGVKSTFELLSIPRALPLLPEICHAYTLIIFEALFLAVIHDRGLTEALVAASTKPLFALDRILGD